MRIGQKIISIANFYIDGFRGMTWGRPLWILIFLKLIILFLVLRLFFFKPVLAGRSDEEKSQFVGERLVEKLVESPNNNL